MTGDELSPDQLRRIDKESITELAGIKRLVEQRMQAHHGPDAASTWSTIRGARPR